uniref:Protein FAM32A n=1 Tax=Panagrellus redivivus TaxID=6233 RepID=A0A7E4VJF3_PANRE
MSSTDAKKEVVIKGGLKIKKGNNLFKKKKVEIKEIDISIKKDAEETIVKKTPAQIAFEKRQRETAYERLKNKAAVSHRERVAKFNKDMEERSEFNDIPKVSWTK